MARQVIVVPHDPRWAAAFEQASKEVAPCFGDNLVAIDHIGSTSIPNIFAKPIIDMLAVVKDIAAVNQCNDAISSRGYVARGELGIPGRRYFFRNDDSGIRTHQIHAFQHGQPGVGRHLAFRDYLIAHPHIASLYSDLKRRLAAEHPQDIDAYMDGKDAFIKEVEAAAIAWAAVSPQLPLLKEEDQTNAFS